MKNFERSNPCLSLCGLNCLLCPMQLSGHCGGCGFGSQYCPIARCSLEHGKLEYCSECEEYPCRKYDHIDEWDSFVTHQNQKANLESRQCLGTERYNEEQVKRREILDRLLAEYNDGRRKTLFCLAANLLELEEHMYPLVDVEYPNTFRNLFPYTEVPKIAFNDRIVPHHMPDEIWITDTTFRDGQQSRTPYTTDQIVTIFDYLHKLGGPRGIVRQSEFFLYSKKDRDAVYKCLERGYKFPEVTSWIRANHEDFKLVRDLGLKETGILVSCSDYHIFYKMKMTRREAMQHYLDIIRDCLEIGVSPRCHLEDITRADIYGYVIPFCLELRKLMDFYQIPIKVRCCDTMGYGVNYPGAVIPRSVPGIIYGIQVHAGFPSELIEWHGHNDFYKAVSNSTTAWLYGASGVNCSLFGIGERTGNTPLEAMVFEYAQLRGTLDGMDTTVITDLAEYYEKEIGYRIPPRTPFVGRSFNVTRAGIHADGLLKNEEIYNIFDTEKFLKRPPVVAVSNTSGLAGIAHWINTWFHLKGEQAIDKNTELVHMVKAWVDNEYESGRVTVLTDEELLAVIQDACDKLGITLEQGGTSES